MRPLAGVFAVLVCAFAAQAQDVLTIGTGTAQVKVKPGPVVRRT